MAGQLTLANGVNLTPLVVTGYEVDGTNAFGVLDLSGTWNTSGAPIALKLNITDVTSSVGSLLLALEVNGISEFQVSKGGAVSVLQSVEVTGAEAGQNVGFTGTKYNDVIGAGSGFTFRGRAASGTKDAPGPTKSGQVIANFTAHSTPDGVSFFGHAETILLATQDHDATHRGTKMTFGVTPQNDVTRRDSWKFASSAPDMPHLQPNDGFDNQCDLGSTGLRVRSAYVGTGLMVGSGTAAIPNSVALNAPPGTVRDFLWLSSGVRRWHLRANSAGEGGGDSGSDLVLRAYSDTGATVDDVFTITRAAGGAISTPRRIQVTLTTANQTALGISGFNLTGANAQPLVSVSGQWNTSAKPTAVLVDVTDSASAAGSSLLDLQVGGSSRFRIPKEGGAILQSSALATNATRGFLYIPACAGAPTGTPSAEAGTVPIVFDTVNNRLYAYTGTWISTALT